MPNLALFEEKISSSLTPSLTAKELAERIVIAALESEYGRSFTALPGFAKMVNILADSIVAHPELRRQALAIATTYIKKHRDNKKSIT